MKELSKKVSTEESYEKREESHSLIQKKSILNRGNRASGKVIRYVCVQGLSEIARRPGNTEAAAELLEMSSER